MRGCGGEGECLGHTVKRLEIVETRSGCHGVGSRRGSVYTRDGDAEQLCGGGVYATSCACL